MTENRELEILETEALFGGMPDALQASSMRSPFSEVNALSITQAPVPQEWVKTRRSGSTELSYVSGDTVTRILNKAFRNRWSFEVKESREVMATNRQGTQQGIIQVLGRMTVPGWGIREQWGSQPLVGGAEVQEHAYKSAATDAMKKCASMFGIALDLYGMAGAEHLMITPQDFLRDDEKVFEDLREKIRLAQEQKARQNQPQAEPVSLEEMAEEEAAPQTQPQAPIAEQEQAPEAPVQQPAQEQPAQVSAEVMSDVAMVQGVEAEPEAMQPTVEPTEPARPTQAQAPVWSDEDIEGMRSIMAQMGMTRNAELNPYVQQFMRSEEATISRHITPVNVKDFIVFMNNIIREQDAQ